MIIRQLTLFAIFSASITAAGAAGNATKDITILDAWSRATPGTARTGVVYLTIEDSGAPDRLTALNTPIAATASLHESKTVDGVMQMSPIVSLTVDSAKPVTLKPGGYHIMLEGLKQPLKAGDRFPLTLTFDHAGTIETTVAVQQIGAAAPEMGDMKGMDMSGMH